MKRLWAPWRMPYLKSDMPKGCIFCQKMRQRKDSANLILYRGKRVFVMMNLYPYSNGHLLVTPYDHLDTLEGLDDGTLSDLMAASRLSLKALRKVFHPDAFNLGINQGRVAGAGIESHVHLHIVPRWNGDTNFMPVLADTRVIPEDLESTYARLKPHFSADGRSARAGRTTRKPRSKGRGS